MGLQTGGGGGVGGRKPGIEHNGSVLGAPTETVVDIDGEMSWGGSYKVTATVGRCIRKHEVEDGVGG